MYGGGSTAQQYGVHPLNPAVVPMPSLMGHLSRSQYPTGPASLAMCKYSKLVISQPV